MRFRIISINTGIGLMVRHFIRNCVLKENMRRYEHFVTQSHRQLDSMNRVGELMPVKVIAPVRVQIVGVVS